MIHVWGESAIIVVAARITKERIGCHSFPAKIVVIVEAKLYTRYGGRISHIDIGTKVDGVGHA